MSAPRPSDPVLKALGAEPIPGYRLLAPLGRGGFGEVWKCEVPGGLHKAIKFVGGSDHVFSDPAGGAAQELRALQHVKSIRHPFLLALDRVEYVGSELVIVMELADRSLHDLLEEFREVGLPGIPRLDLLLYLREAAEVLDLMNVEYGLQHLDVKPRNLFLVRQHVKVGDFGLVNSLAEIDRRTAALTPQYAAPESFVGNISPKSDQYSLALVYHELLTGQRVFGGRNLRQLAMQHTVEEPDLDGLPESDRPAVARALAKSPEQRFPSCMDFVQALLSAQPEGSPTEALPPQRPTPSLVQREKPRTDVADQPTRVLCPESSPAPTAVVAAAAEETVSLDELRYLDCLGRSPLGELWKVQTPRGEPRLLKIVSTQGAGEDDLADRLRRLRHPRLVPTTVLAHPPGRLALLSPLARDSLAQRLQEAREGGPGLTRTEVLTHLLEAAQTLDELHRTYGLAHLGLTPRCLLLDQGELRLDDYGLLPLIWLPTRRGFDRVNPRYGGPELLASRGAARAGAACDQYSLALIYYELMTGVHLFGGLSQRQLAVVHKEGRLRLDLLPGSDRAAVTRALSPDPKQRFPSCADFIRALPGALAGREERALSLSPCPAAAPALPLLTDVVSADYEQAVAELATLAAGSTQVRDMGTARYLCRPGESIEHRLFARLTTADLRLKLAGWRKEWQAEAPAGDDVTLFHVPLPAGFWRRWRGGRPGLEVLLTTVPPPEGGELTDVAICVRPLHCVADEAVLALDRNGPTLLESLRWHLRAGPERRAHERIPFPQTVEVSPVVDRRHVGEPLVCEARDLSRDGLGLTMPCQPTSAVVVYLPRPSGEPLAVPARVVHISPSGDRYTVGLRFGLPA